MAPITGGKMAEDAFRILLVDDSDVDREIAARHLRNAWPFEGGMAVHTARDGREAWALTQAADYVLILLDWRMTGGNGAEFLQNLRRQKITTPVVVLTGLQRDEVNLNLPELGAVFLSKDELTVSALREAISATAGLQPQRP
jgi:two-component system chemotaxis response regulator CheB